ncbi:MAG: hypothetical protein QW650_00350 [Thermofilum sp.]
MTAGVGMSVLKTLRKHAEKGKMFSTIKNTLDLIGISLASAVSAATLAEILQKNKEKKEREKLLQTLLTMEDAQKDTEKTAQKKKLISSIVEKKIKLAENQEDMEKLAEFVADLSEKSVEELSAINDHLARKLALKELEFGKSATRTKSAQEALEEFLLGGGANA